MYKSCVRSDQQLHGKLGYMCIVRVIQIVKEKMNGDFMLVSYLAGFKTISRLWLLQI
jgi:hypothetical protein